MWLYREYKGALLIVVAHDGKDNIVFMAQALVQGETQYGIFEKFEKICYSTIFV